jgi:hypothetical protein
MLFRTEREIRTRALARLQAGQINGHTIPDLLAVGGTYARGQILLAFIDAQDDYRRDMARLTGGEAPHKRTLKALRQMAREILRDISKYPVPFAQWAAKRTDNPAGDLVADLRDDSYSRQSRGESLPYFTSAQGVREYIESHGACDGAVQAVPKVWKRYESHCALRAMFG